MHCPFPASHCIGSHPNTVNAPTHTHTHTGSTSHLDTLIHVSLGHLVTPCSAAYVCFERKRVRKSVCVCVCERAMSWQPGDPRPSRWKSSMIAGGPVHMQNAVPSQCVCACVGKIQGRIEIFAHNSAEMHIHTQTQCSYTHSAMHT